MTINQGDTGWVRATFDGLDFEDYPRYSMRHGVMLQDHAALPAVATWLHDNAGVVVESTEFVVEMLGRQIKRTDDLDESAYADSVLAIMCSLLAALEGE